MHAVNPKMLHTLCKIYWHHCDCSIVFSFLTPKNGLNIKSTPSPSITFKAKKIFTNMLVSWLIHVSKSKFEHSISKLFKSIIPCHLVFFSFPFHFCHFFCDITYQGFYLHIFFKPSWNSWFLVNNIFIIIKGLLLLLKLACGSQGLNQGTSASSWFLCSNDSLFHCMFFQENVKQSLTT